MIGSGNVSQALDDVNNAAKEVAQNAQSAGNDAQQTAAITTAVGFNRAAADFFTVLAANGSTDDVKRGFANVSGALINLTDATSPQTLASLGQ